MVWYSISAKIPEPGAKVWFGTNPPDGSKIHFARNLKGIYDASNAEFTYTRRDKSVNHIPIKCVGKWTYRKDGESNERICSYTMSDALVCGKTFEPRKSEARFVKVLIPDGRKTKREVAVDLVNLPYRYELRNADGDLCASRNIVFSSRRGDFDVLCEDVFIENRFSFMDEFAKPAVVVAEIYKLPNGEAIEVPLTANNSQGKV